MTIFLSAASCCQCDKNSSKNFHLSFEIIEQPIFMDMIDLNLEHREVKVCPEDLMEAQTLIVEEDCSLGSVDEQNVSDLSSAETLLDSTSTNTDDDVDLPYQFRSNEGVTYRVIQVSGAITPDSDSSSLPQIISASPTLTTTQQLQTVFTNPLNGQLYVIGAADEVYPKANSHHKPIAPRTESVVESVRSPGISRDDRRRATHNEVERRRRDKINNWILKLSKIVPECHLDSSKGFDVQPSKGGILAKTCDYILELSESNQKLMNVFKDNERLIAEVSKQKAMNEHLLLENAELKNILKQNGLTLSSCLKSEL